MLGPIDLLVAEHPAPGAQGGAAAAIKLELTEGAAKPIPPAVVAQPAEPRPTTPINEVAPAPALPPNPAQPLAPNNAEEVVAAAPPPPPARRLPAYGITHNADLERLLREYGPATQHQLLAGVRATPGAKEYPGKDPIGALRVDLSIMRGRGLVDEQHPLPRDVPKGEQLWRWNEEHNDMDGWMTGGTGPRNARRLA